MTGGASPLSFQQQELIRQIRAAPDCAQSFDNVFVFRVTGELDFACFEASVRDLVVRHPALRTMLARFGGKDVQVVDTGGYTEVLLEDGQVDAEGVVAALMEQRCQLDELFGARPLFRVCIHRLPREVLLSFSLHHLVSDGWSVPVLWRDLSEIYAARTTGRSPRLPALAYDYTDFATAQRNAWGRQRDAILSFWGRELLEYPRRISWPAANAEKSESTLSNVESFTLPQETVKAAHGITRSHRVSPFLVLLAASALAASRVTGQSELLLGSNVANRDSLSWRDVIGYFTNTRLTKSTAGSVNSLGDMVNTLREHWLTGDTYRDVYIDQLLEGLGRPGLVKIDMLNLPGFSASGIPGFTGDAPSFPDVLVEAVPTPQEKNHWRDINLIWVPTQSGFRLDIRHRPSLIESSTVQELGREVMAVFDVARVCK